jgi:hypothetical protein
MTPVILHLTPVILRVTAVRWSLTPVSLCLTSVSLRVAAVRLARIPFSLRVSAGWTAALRVRPPYSWHPHVPNRHPPPAVRFGVRLNRGQRVRAPDPRRLSSSEDRLLPFSSSTIGAQPAVFGPKPLAQPVRIPVEGRGIR